MMNARSLRLASILVALTGSAWAQGADVSVFWPECRNTHWDVAAAERVTACTRILKLGTLTPDQQSEALLDRAWSYSLIQRMADARADYDRAIALTPKSHMAYNERALFNLRVGRLDDAITDYDLALSFKPGAAYSLYGRGLAFLRKGDETRGREDLAAARRADSSVDDVFRKIGVTP
jgi:lipoprotein NlpI